MKISPKRLAFIKARLVSLQKMFHEQGLPAKEASDRAREMLNAEMKPLPPAK